ncbi:MAG: lysozyme inhibitor LprI family protein [Paracoccus sp. (in: a-proteobacteria)]|nr:lysozyme inhibitor LprI family protein [Paracoccus sp. (in: a-proteobacteria)]
MKRIAFCLAVLAAPAAAQDGAGPDAAALLDGCLDGARAQDQLSAWDSCIGVVSRACLEASGGSSTVAIATCLRQEYELWDARLNQSYQAVLAASEATDKEMAELGSAAEAQAPLLREMEQSWTRFRDAACAYERSRWGGGTGGGPAALDCMIRLTAQHSVWLQQYESDAVR